MVKNHQTSQLSTLTICFVETLGILETFTKIGIEWSFPVGLWTGF